MDSIKDFFRVRMLALYALVCVIGAMGYHEKSREKIPVPVPRTFADCARFSYVDSRGGTVRAQLFGVDADGDGLVAKPTDPNSLFASAEYLCGFSPRPPVGYRLIETEYDIGADEDDAVRNEKWH